MDKAEAKKITSNKPIGSKAALNQGLDNGLDFIIREVRKATVIAADIDDEDYIPDL